MVRIVQTLNGMPQLRESGFGLPWPRHGLKLLYWFSTRCISFDGNNEMVSRCNPRRGHFGFHYFNNTPDQDGLILLPDEELPYYMVGNLFSPGANRLPGYVREDRALNNGNKDRIIISLDDEMVDRVYVTSHIDDSEFDIDSTFRISRGLLTSIRRHQDVDDFLSEMDFHRRPAHPVQHVHVEVAPIRIRAAAAQVNRNPGFWETYCTIL
uniref:Wu:fc75a09 n=1 Tax=Astyanax mexicanus TaxID=7994 RepID=A0A8B9RM29_ASTMX